jgi:hypothetical protein
MKKRPNGDLPRAQLRASISSVYVLFCFLSSRNGAIETAASASPRNQRREKIGVLWIAASGPNLQGICFPQPCQAEEDSSDRADGNRPQCNDRLSYVTHIIGSRSTDLSEKEREHVPGWRRRSWPFWLWLPITKSHKFGEINRLIGISTGFPWTNL